MLKTNRPIRGFTIVELLIVVVVIAILASVTIVAYSGIQQQARTARALTAIDSYEKALRMYYVEHGAYPAAAVQTCIGTGYPATTTFNENACLVLRIGEDAPLQMLHATGSIDSQLAPYLGATIRVDATEYQRTGSGMVQFARGLQYQALESAGEWTVRLTYAIGTDDTCGRGELQEGPGWTGFKYCALVFGNS